MDITSLQRTARFIAAGGLAGAAAIHAAWAAGSSWPAADQARLAEAGAGTPQMPPRAASAAMAGLLGVAAAAAGSRRSSRLLTLVRLGTAVALATRAALGADTATGLLGMPEPGPTFRRLNARLYQPLCGVLAAATACSALGARGRPA